MCRRIMWILLIAEAILSGNNEVKANEQKEEQKKDEPSSITGKSTRNARGYLSRMHSFLKPYHGTASNFWDLVGNALVSDRFIRLTNLQKHRQGAIWNRFPVKFRNWELEVAFDVHGNEREFGDGIALWYTKEQGQLGPVFGSTDKFRGLAIFLDTYKNDQASTNQYPFISAMLNGRRVQRYDHSTDGVLTRLGGVNSGCHVPFRNLEHPAQILVTYLNNSLSVHTNIHGYDKGYWSPCFVGIKNVYLPDQFFFGISAATGKFSDFHDVISVKVYQLEGANRTGELTEELENFSDIDKGEDKEDTEERPRNEDAGDWENDEEVFSDSRWMLLTALWIVFLIIIGCILKWVLYAADHWYSTAQRKRFY